MRNAFAKAITAAAVADPRIMLLSGDIGNRLFNDYKAQRPKQFINCGVAEANMTGVAAGLAMCGMRPFTYTIVPFVTVRCLEQIRVDVCYHRQPVTIVGVGGGLSYASLGATHYLCEDLAMLRCIPELRVVCPADAFEVTAAVRAAVAGDGPLYLRLGKKNEPLVHEDVPKFEIGKAIWLARGDDVCFVGCGHILPVLQSAVAILEAEGVRCGLVSSHTVKPLDDEMLTDAFTGTRLVVTAEEHSRIGGFSSAVSEWLTGFRGPRAPQLAIGSDDFFIHGATSVAHARETFSLTPELIADQVRCRLAEL